LLLNIVAGTQPRLLHKKNCAALSVTERKLTPTTKWNKHCNVAFTLSGFDDQERNLTFVKTDFKVLKLKISSLQF